MYVIPFSMGPIGSPLARVGVQVRKKQYRHDSDIVMGLLGRAARNGDNLQRSAHILLTPFLNTGDGLAICRGQYAHHDPHWSACARCPR